MFFINKNSNNFSFLHLNHFFFLYNYKKKSTRTSSCSRHKRFIEQKKTLAPFKTPTKPYHEPSKRTFPNARLISQINLFSVPSLLRKNRTGKRWRKARAIRFERGTLSRPFILDILKIVGRIKGLIFLSIWRRYSRRHSIPLWPRFDSIGHLLLSPPLRSYHESKRSKLIR